MFDFSRAKNSDQRGVILIMTLVILGLILTSVLVLSQLVVGDLKMALNSSNSIGAYYAADSGVEKALYYIKYSRANSDFASFEGLASTDTVINSDASFEVKIASISDIGFTAYDLSPTNAATLNILDPTGNVDHIDWDPGGTNAYYLSWEIADCFPNHASDRLAIEQVSFSSRFEDRAIEKKVLICNCSYEGKNICSTSASSYSVDSNKYYRFYFRPIDGAVDKLEFNLKENGSDKGILSQANVEVEGEYHNSKYLLKAKIPSLVPVSDIFSYVLFSEEDLNK